ncbi:glycosyltransferase family 2 protein [Methylorubrum sp. SB2]|uniref:glycosyltransferase family 2 protein n=1 Tax=Methylorubrum subtropicum TaxID=3138812 RepID=UPI00313EB48D
MTIVMTLLVRDEEDILRENLAFHLDRGVDHVILMDNASVDGTAEIAHDFARSGVLTYLHQPEDDYAQGRWVTAMARRAFDEFGAAWVINNDADEFWWPRHGSLRDALATIPPDALAASAERTNFVARTPETGRFWQRMDVRCRVSLNPLGRPLPGKVAHRGAADIEVAQGNHAATRPGQAPSVAPAPILILHFPVRTRAQLVNKIAKGGAAYARNTDLDPGIGSTWRILYDTLRRDGLDAVYEGDLYDAARIGAGLRDGSLIRDERLKQALAALPVART